MEKETKKTLEGLFNCRRIKSLLDGSELTGADPIAVMDAGAIIDLEEYARQPAMLNHDAGLILQNNPNFYVITPLVLKELERHVNMKINGHVPELTQNTINTCYKIANRSKLFLTCLEQRTNIDMDPIRYQTWLASHSAFEKGHKKREQDIVSRTDQEIVANSFIIAQARYVLGETGPIVVISPDKHVTNTIQLMNDLDEYPNKVGIFSIRSLN